MQKEVCDDCRAGDDDKIGDGACVGNKRNGRMRVRQKWMWNAGSRRAWMKDVDGSGL